MVQLFQKLMGQMKDDGIRAALSVSAIGVLLLTVVLVAGCSSDLTADGDGDGSDGDGSGADGSDGTGTGGDGSGNNTGDGSGGNGDNNGGPGFDVCGEVTSELTRIPTRVMLLLDRSGSMRDEGKWDASVNAINTMVSDFDALIAFGIDYFSISDSRTSTQRACLVAESVELDALIDHSGPVLTSLDDTEPMGGTPLYLGMANYLNPQYAPAFLDDAGDSYLVVISDGIDNCGTDGVYQEERGASDDELREVTEELLANRGLRTIVIGFGDEADPDQLNAIAAAGGSPYGEFIDAADGAALNAALLDIAQTVVVSCEFRIGTFDDDSVNLDLVNVTFDNVAVPRDDNCAADTGWTWADAEKTIIQFCQAACATLESETVEKIRVQVACNEDDVVIIELE